MAVPAQIADERQVIGSESRERAAIDADLTKHRWAIGVNPVERKHRQPGRKSPLGGARPKSAVKHANGAAAAAPLVQIAHQEHRVGFAPVRGKASAEGRHEPIRLQPPLTRAQAEMRRYDAQYPITEQKVGVDCPARLVAGDGEVDRARGQHWKAGQDRVAKAPILDVDTGAKDDPAPGRLAQIGPLIGVPPGAAASIDFLQAGDIGIDFAQYRGNAARVIAPVDANAGMNVVGYDANRTILGVSERVRPSSDAGVGFRPALPFGVQK